MSFRKLIALAAIFLATIALCNAMSWLAAPLFSSPLLSQCRSSAWRSNSARFNQLSGAESEIRATWAALQDTPAFQTDGYEITGEKKQRVSQAFIRPNRFRKTIYYGSSSTVETVIGDTIYYCSGDLPCAVIDLKDYGKQLNQIYSTLADETLPLTSAKRIGKKVINEIEICMYEYQTGSLNHLSSDSVKLWINLATGLPYQKESTTTYRTTPSSTVQNNVFYTYQIDVAIEPPQ